MSFQAENRVCKRHESGPSLSLDQVFLGKKQLDDEMVARLEESGLRWQIGVKNRVRATGNEPAELKLWESGGGNQPSKALIKDIL